MPMEIGNKNVVSLLVIFQSSITCGWSEPTFYESKERIINDAVAFFDKLNIECRKYIKDDALYTKIQASIFRYIGHRKASIDGQCDAGSMTCSNTDHRKTIEDLKKEVEVTLIEAYKLVKEKRVEEQNRKEEISKIINLCKNEKVKFLKMCDDVNRAIFDLHDEIQRTAGIDQEKLNKILTSASERMDLLETLNDIVARDYFIDDIREFFVKAKSFRHMMHHGLLSNIEKDICILDNERVYANLNGLMTNVNTSVEALDAFIRYFDAQVKYGTKLKEMINDNNSAIRPTICDEIEVETEKDIDAVLSKLETEEIKQNEGAKNSFKVLTRAVGKIDKLNVSEVFKTILNLRSYEFVNEWFPPLARTAFYKIITGNGNKEKVDQSVTPELKIAAHFKPFLDLIKRQLMIYLKFYYEILAAKEEMDMVCSRSVYTTLLLRQVIFKAKKALFDLEDISKENICPEDWKFIEKLPRSIIKVIGIIYAIQKEQIEPLFRVYGKALIIFDTLDPKSWDLSDIMKEWNNEESRQNILKSNLDAHTNLKNNENAENQRKFEKFTQEFMRTNKNLSTQLEGSWKHRMGRYKNKEMEKKFDVSNIRSENNLDRSKIDTDKKFNDFKAKANHASCLATKLKEITTQIEQPNQANGMEGEHDQRNDDSNLLSKMANLLDIISKVHFEESKNIERKYRMESVNEKITRFYTLDKCTSLIQMLAIVKVKKLDIYIENVLSITKKILYISKAKGIIDSYRILKENQAANPSLADGNFEETVDHVSLPKNFNFGKLGKVEYDLLIEEASSVVDDFAKQHLNPIDQNLELKSERSIGDIAGYVHVLLDYILDLHYSNDTDKKDEIKSVMEKEREKLKNWLRLYNVDFEEISKAIFKKIYDAEINMQQKQSTVDANTIDQETNGGNQEQKSIYNSTADDSHETENNSDYYAYDSIEQQKKEQSQSVQNAHQSSFSKREYEPSNENSSIKTVGTDEKLARANKKTIPWVKILFTIGGVAFGMLVVFVVGFIIWSHLK